MAFFRKTGYVLTVSFFLMALLPRFCFSLPVLDSIDSGSADFSYPDANTLSITASDKAIVNYSSFDIGENESVIITLPNANNEILNRVTGGSFSSILGRLSSNGIIYLVNPNGITFGSTAVVNAAGLVASTRDITNSNFLNSNYVFERLSQGQDKLLLNKGTISIQRNGFIALIAGAVENQGIILAPLGTIAMAGGDMITLGISADGLISIAIDKATASSLVDTEGNPVVDQIKNTGTLEADGGLVLLNAESLPGLFEKAINLEGYVKAERIEVTAREVIATATLTATQQVSVTADSLVVKAIAPLTYIYKTNEMKLTSSVLEDKLVTLVGEGIAVTYLYSTNLFLQTDNAVTTTPGVIIQANQVNVLAKQFGTTEFPLNIDASTTYINRTLGSIDILESQGLGTSILLRGPPEGFGAIVYNHNTKLILEASQIILSSSEPTYLFGDITFSNFTCTVPDKEIYFEAGKTYTFKSSLNIIGSPDIGTEEYYIKLRSQTPGSQWYLNIQADTYTLERVNISDAYSQNLVNIPIGIDSGNNINFDIDPVWDNGSGNGLWSTATNWDGNAVPTGSQTVTFNNTSTANCSIDNVGTWSSGTFTIASTYTGTITVNVSSLTIGAFSQAGGAFNGGSATLNIASFSLTGGTFTSTSGTLNITGNFSRTAGTFTHNSGTVVFTAFYTSITSGGQSFYNLTINGDFDWDMGDYYSLTLNDALSVANDLTLNAVNLITSDYAVNVTRDYAQSGGGTTSAGSSTITVGRHFSADGATSETGYNSASIVLTGTGNLSYTNLTAPWSNGFYNLTCGQNGNTTTALTTIGVNNVLTIGSGALTGGITVCLNGSGNVLSFNSASTLSTTQINFYSTSGTVNIPALNNGYGCSINVSNNNTVISQTGDITLNAGNLSITTDTFTGRTATWNTNGYSLTVGGNITLGVAGDTATKTLNITNSTLTIGGNFTIASAQAVFTSTGSTVVFNGSSTQLLTSGGESFNNITHSGSGTLQIQDALDVNGAFVNSAGTFNANNKNMNFAGDWSNTGSATFTRGSATLTFDGTTILANSSSNAADLGALTITGTVTLGSNVTITSCSGAGTLNLGAGSYTLTISGTGSPLGVTTFNKGTGSTVIYTGSGTTTNIATVTYNNLTLTPASATTYNLTGNLTGTNALSGNLAINNGATLDATTNNYNIEVAGNWSNSGAFTARSGTVTFSGTGTSTISNSNTFYNLTCTTAGATLSFSAATTQTINGTLNLEGASGNRLTLIGNSGSVNPKGSVTTSYLDVNNFPNLGATIYPSGSAITNSTGWQAFTVQQAQQTNTVVDQVTNTANNIVSTQPLQLLTSLPVLTINVRAPEIITPWSEAKEIVSLAGFTEILPPALEETKPKENKDSKDKFILKKQ